MSFFNEPTNLAITEIIVRFMEGVIARRVVAEPWDYVEYQNSLPFHVALVPEEIWKGAKFERSFVTSLGMIGWENIARVIAADKRGTARNGERIVGQIYASRQNKIESIMRELEHKARRPSWDVEFEEIMSTPGDKLVPITIVADLYIENSDSSEKLCFEIKAPKPNSDQTQVSKKKILELLALEDPIITGAYFALPFNPYGARADYTHSHPQRWFNMHEDKVVLMGKEFWDLLGGVGTYEALIKIFEAVGDKYKSRIRTEYLGLE